MNNSERLIPRRGLFSDIVRNITDRGDNRDIRITTGRHAMTSMDIDTEIKTDRRNPVQFDRTQDTKGAMLLPELPIGLQPVARSPVNIFAEKVLQTYYQSSSGDDSYQPLVAGPDGANVSHARRYSGQPRNLDNSVGGRVVAPSRSPDVSPNNSYQSFVTSPGGANVSGDRHTTIIQRNTENFVGQTGHNFWEDESVVSSDDSYQSSVTSHVGANVSGGDADPPLPRNTDDSGGRTVFFAEKPVGCFSGQFVSVVGDEPSGHECVCRWT